VHSCVNTAFFQPKVEGKKIFININRIVVPNEYYLEKRAYFNHSLVEADKMRML